MCAAALPRRPSISLPFGPPFAAIQFTGALVHDGRPLAIEAITTAQRIQEIWGTPSCCDDDDPDDLAPFYRFGSLNVECECNASGHDADGSSLSIRIGC